MTYEKSWGGHDAHVVQVRAALAAEPGDAAALDMDYVLWTDPDVLFETNIDSCSLPRPRLLSVGAEARRFWMLRSMHGCCLLYEQAWAGGR